MSADPKLATLWLGDRLSFVEILAIKSILAQGHSLTLFAYGDVSNVPEGVEIRDAREVYEPKALIVHERTKTPAPQADIFRIKLLRATDYVWIDADMLLLKPLPADEYIFAWESPQSIGNSVLGLPSDSEALKRADEFVDDWLDKLKTPQSDDDFGTGYGAKNVEMHVATLGPHLMTRVLKETGEAEHALPKESFFPIDIGEVKLLFRRPKLVNERVTSATIGVHLWAWRLRRKVLRDCEGSVAEFIKGTYLADVLAKFDINPDDDPIVEMEMAASRQNANKG